MDRKEENGMDCLWCYHLSQLFIKRYTLRAGMIWLRAYQQVINHMNYRWYMQMDRAMLRRWLILNRFWCLLILETVRIDTSLFEVPYVTSLLYELDHPQPVKRISPWPKFRIICNVQTASAVLWSFMNVPLQFLDDAYRGCTQIVDILIRTAFDNLHGYLFDYTQSKLYWLWIMYVCSSEVVLPSTMVWSICHCAWVICYQLQSLCIFVLCVCPL